MISSSLGLCLAARPVRGSVLITLAGLGWPTLCRALALTALAAENFPGLRFFMASMSMKEVLRKWKGPPGFQVLDAGAEEIRGSWRQVFAGMENWRPWKSAIFSTKRPKSASTR